MPELYAAIILFECFRVAISDVMASGSRSGFQAKLTVCDVSMTHFYVPPIRLVYVKITGEEWMGGGEEARCGGFNVSMCGARVVVLNWQAAFLIFSVRARPCFSMFRLPRARGPNYICTLEAVVWLLGGTRRWNGLRRACAIIMNVEFESWVGNLKATNW